MSHSGNKIMADNLNFPKECWCSVPVHSGARIAAWISIVCAVVLGIYHFPYNMPFAALNILVSALLLYGLSRNRPKMMLPYLVWTIISYIIQFVFSSFQLTQMGARPGLQHYSEGAIAFSLLLFLALMMPIIYVFIVVPYRSYKLLKWEVLNTNDAPPPYSKGNYVSAAQNPA